MESETNTPIVIKQEHLYKVLVIGEFGVGKTSIIKRYTEGYFTPNYKLTIGVDFALKTIEWDAVTRVNLQLWDIAGHERFGHMTRVYYKYAIAAIIVFDVSRPATFDSVTKWLSDVNSKVMLADGDPVPVLLLANKADVESVDIDTKALSEFCKEHKFIGWFPTSAKDNVNIDEAMDFLVKRITELPVEGQKPIESIKLSNAAEEFEEESSFEDDNVSKKSSCCS
ncbi:ras-related protein Rab-32B-like [Lineus longissimus]|uniref:ras-related protein Rab-32B-like n=1 Tax=Lineus longissimus TaxID=88925 RepID=UPI00315DA092